MDKPAFVVIAGPNGAGKSFFSSNKNDSIIIDFGINSFDFDLAYSNLYDKFSSIMTSQIESNLVDRVKEIFHEKIDLAIKDRTNFSFQTNFDKAYTDKWRKVFKDCGYKTYLFFLYMESTKICKERVIKRVQEGGHFVDDRTIEKRYESGLQNFELFFSEYDEVNLIDTSDSQKILKLLKIENSEVTYLNNRIGNVIFTHNLYQLGSFIKSNL